MSMCWTTVSDRDFTLMRDEFGNYSHAADKTPISFQEQKKILGNRIKRLRLYREMTQEEAAEKTGINATLWRHYEYGLKMPRQENLEKISTNVRCSDANAISYRHLHPGGNRHIAAEYAAAIWQYGNRRG